MIIGSQENNVRRGGGCESLVHKHPWALLAKLFTMSEPLKLTEALLEGQKKLPASKTTNPEFNNHSVVFDDVFEQ